jgi:hypothetical protein
MAIFVYSRGDTAALLQAVLQAGAAQKVSRDGYQPCVRIKYGPEGSYARRHDKRRSLTPERERPVRLALTVGEAAQTLGCSRDFFDEHIGPELRWIRRGRLKFVAIAELEDWLRRSAAFTLQN